MKIDFEKIFLVVLFSLLLWAGYANLSGQMLAHDFPVGYLAADAVQDWGWAENIKDSGNYAYFPEYASAGFSKVIAWYAPVLMHGSVLMSYASGLEVYDMLIFLVYFFAALSALAMYFLIKRLDRNTAILSAPLMLFIFFRTFYYAFLLGQWAYVSGALFLVASFWAISRLELDKSYILLAIFIMGNIFTHPSELVFIILITGIYILINLISKNFKLDELKSAIIAFAISAALSSYFFLVLKLSAAGEFSGVGGALINFKPIEPHYGYPPVYINEFGLVLIPIAAGLLLSFLYIRKKNSAALAAGLLMLAVGFFNYLGGSIGDRAFQNRFFWPVYFSVFFGLAVYLGLKLVIKEWKITYSVAVSVMLMIAFMFIFYTKVENASLVDSQHWQAYKWIEKNTPKESEILFLYGDPYSQTSNLWFTKRLSKLIDYQDYAATAVNGTIKRHYTARHVSGYLFYRKGLFSSGNYVEEKGLSYFKNETDICDFDYYVFDKLTAQQPGLVQYNLAVRDNMIKNGMEEAFSNQLVSVVKNKNRGVNCIG